MCVVCIVFCVMVFVVRLVVFCDTFGGMTCGCLLFFSAVTRVFVLFLVLWSTRKAKLNTKNIMSLQKNETQAACHTETTPCIIIPYHCHFQQADFQ